MANHMDLLDRYLQAVRSYLPRKHQADIIDELSEDIRSHVDEKETELGRPLNESELEQLIKQYGHPMVLAGRYSGRQQLIGPTLFPFYWLTLKAALWIALGVSTILACLAPLMGGGEPGQRMLGSFIGLPGVLINVFAWVTLVFAALEFGQVKLNCFVKWSPRRLPALSTSKPVSRLGIYFELICTAIFLSWLVFASRATIPFGVPFIFSPAWHGFYPVFVGLVLAQMVQLTVNLARPDWTRFRSVALLMINIAAIAVYLFLLRAGDLVAIAPGAPNLERLRPVLDVINYSVYIGLVVAGVVSAWEAFKEIRTLVRGRRHTVSATSPNSYSAFWL